ncbi:hypothetical protein EVAR_66840_1 [Eumeta japonica]|uniref:Uncharacterized protein n=1 Tax=Eumeta variegata TaxID=151549 RepID=A0A4C1ZB10_EUMVA|nr:hypothetical protein EVAR_66840_1 [Eumeta japonica]
MQGSASEIFNGHDAAILILRFMSTDDIEGPSVKARDYSRVKCIYNVNICHVLVHEFMSICYALAGWSGNRERRDERTKRKREKDKDRRIWTILSTSRLTSVGPGQLTTAVTNATTLSWTDGITCSSRIRSDWFNLAQEKN